MPSLLERKLIVVTGKGGTGKTTVACALGLVAARRGLRTIVVEVGEQHRLPTLFGVGDGERPRSSKGEKSEDSDEEKVGWSDGEKLGGSDREKLVGPGGERFRGVGKELKLRESLWSTSVDPDRAMIEWVGALAGRIPARVLAGSSTFHYLAAAAPGAKELVTMRKLLELERRYDLVVLDAPATGHALGMLRSPQTFSAIARVGPMADQTRRVQELLEDRTRCAYVAVAHPSEMAITETLELEEQLRLQIDRDLDAVFVNGTLPQRFTREELLQLDRVPSDEPPVVSAALQGARAVHRRVRVQQSQVARLRRQRFANGGPPRVLTIPFQFTAQLDLGGIEAIADRIQRRL